MLFLKQKLSYRHISIMAGLLLFTIGCKNEYSRIDAIEALKHAESDSSSRATFSNNSFYQVKSFKRDMSVKNPKNIIIMIGDGMGPAQVAGGMIANKGKLFMQQTEYSGFSITQNVYGKITDSAAGATAMATGVKTYNKAIAVDSAGRPLQTLMMEAHQKGLKNGIVVGCEVVDATPASFIVNHPDRNDPEIIADKIIKAPVDFLYGGGRKYFTDRQDGQDLLESWKKKGFELVGSPQDLQAIQQGPVVALVSENAPSNIMERGHSYMSQGLSKALELLKPNPEGFILLVEGSQIDDSGHFNEVGYNVQEVLDFDKTIGEVLQFAAEDGETLVVITADHETGGYTIVDQDMKSGSVTAEFSSTDHTAVMVPVFAYGPGSQNFSGFYQNTEIYHRIRESLNW